MQTKPECNWLFKPHGRFPDANKTRTQQALQTTWMFSQCKQNQNTTGFANHMDSVLMQIKPEHNRLCKQHGHFPDVNKTRTGFANRMVCHIPEVNKTRTQHMMLKVMTFFIHGLLLFYCSFLVVHLRTWGHTKKKHTSRHQKFMILFRPSKSPNKTKYKKSP